MTYLLKGGSGALVTIQGGEFPPIPFADVLDPGSGKGRRRAVDTSTESYQVARQYMVRLGPRDFADAAWVAKLAAAGGFDPAGFRAHFARLLADGWRHGRLSRRLQANCVDVTVAFYTPLVGICLVTWFGGRLGGPRPPASVRGCRRSSALRAATRGSTICSAARSWR